MKISTGWIIALTIAGAIALGLALGLLFDEPSYGAEPASLVVPKESPVIISWIRIDGCPRGQFELFIEFSNGEILHYEKDTAPTADILKEKLGDIDGYYHKFDCGVKI